ncbi:hypothetical protein AALO_G00103060 [Alosa alosa]|uniref:HIT domain-containing protein n=2 Tax=Alosa alosa TaxID=278164 RepID=A0AAV6H0K4_9TELE|nr:uncharacterized protein LOC125296971 isoform X1 [Alosa alosa]KAG5278816.1 hypothetical protein AALO_G00103060 [Alosa alosa]
MIFARILRRMAAFTTTVPERHVIWEAEQLVAFLHPRPWTPGTTVVTLKTNGGPSSLFELPEPDFLTLLLGAQLVGALLCERLCVRRCALIHRPSRSDQGPPQLHLLPLHGLEADWRPHLAAKEDFQQHDPGYCSSKSGPRWDTARLEEMRGRIRAKLPAPEAPPSYAFHGDDPAHPGLFSLIVRGEEQQWRVWEDDGHVAFLTPFPNTPGLTVVVPRRPLTSDILRLEEKDYRGLALATRNAAQLLRESLGAWAVALIFEGFEIDYAHAKLIPLTEPGGNGTHCPPSPPPEFCEIYPGYVTSANGPLASPETLRKMQITLAKV